jgi:AraC-like DNA-binding protein
VPATPVPALAAAVGLGERQLRRRFDAAVGYGPKMLARVARFRRALALVRAGEPPAAAAYEAGYADQAHMTREMRALAGRTPAALRAA